jgi:hypothetical protein
MNFDGAVFAFEAGYWIKIKARRIKANAARPYGLNYSLTLHEPGGGRILGFDNAHVVAEPRSKFKAKPKRNDHWHRTEDDPGRPYEYVDAPTLVADFFREAERILNERDIPFGSMTQTKGGADDEG